MSTKEEILHQIKLSAAEGKLNKHEILAAYKEGCAIAHVAASLENTATKQSEQSKIATILYYIGGAIVFLGIVFFLEQKWSTLSIVTKISTTLGFAVVAYCVGLLLLRDKRRIAVSSAFFLISALVMPLGLCIAFEQAGYSVQDYGPQSLISAILFVVYFGSFILFKRNILMLFGIIFATGLFVSFSYFLVGNAPFFGRIHFYAYLVLVVGFAYLLLGYYFSKSKGPFLWFFYGVGIVCFLGAALYLGGWKPHQSLFWELIFPFLILGSLFFSVRLKSGALLTFGTLFLIAYLFKITAEYFTDSIGWPFSLVISGLLMIVVGYMFFSLKKNMS